MGYRTYVDVRVRVLGVSFGFDQTVEADMAVGTACDLMGIVRMKG